MPTFTTPRFVAAFLFVLAALTVRSPSRAADPNAGHEFFERKIRPLLVQHCWACHAKGQKKGGLSLESRETLMAGGDRGPAIESDAPARSLIVEAVEYAGDLQMPPSGKLTDHEVGLLKQWVGAGVPWSHNANATTGGIRTSAEITAADRQFWSFRPFTRQPLPAVGDATWSRTRIDPFILARLDAESLRPSPQADRRTLLRRAAFDLTGLVPGDDDLAEFLADDGPDAFERAIDRLLASPHHGERWARHWLDVARYGEDQAHTFAARMYPSGYRYRDWVIQSFNRDLPYDQFVVQQVAGDQAPVEQRIEQSPGLGFFALGPVYYADAGCAPKALADEWDDRVDTLGRGFLGLTLACARCHDHKFDPISVQDYYAIAGVFASSRYEEIPLVPVDIVRQYDERVARSKAQDEKLGAAQAAAARQVAESLVPQTARYVVAAWIVSNRRKAQADYADSQAADELGLQATLVEAWRKHLGTDNRKQRGPLADYDQAVAAQDAKVDLAAVADARQVIEQLATALQESLVAALAERKRRETVYAETLAKTPDDQQAMLPKPQLDMPQAELLQTVLYDGKAPFNVPKDRLAKLVSAEQATELESLARETESAKQAIGPKYSIAHGLADSEPKNLQIHLRGNHKTLGDEAPRRFLSILSPAAPALFVTGSGRMELARAIASPENPLTARVIVNRVWQQHFGLGLVETPSNFGTLGAPPSHPELIDDLAAEFVADAWSLKQLHRKLMLSAAYRQGSAHSTVGFERDPENRWLWRAARRRLDIEVWRDAMLQVAGQLDNSIGGVSLNLNDGKHRRRTLYSAVSRHELNGMLRLFDFPDPNLTSERRVVTTVPMQQLFALNSDFMVRQARAMVARLASDAAADDTSKVLAAYRLAFQREPSSEEREACIEFVRQAAEDGAAKLTPWEQLAQTLLAANEFLFVD